MSDDELIKHPKEHIKDIVKHWKRCNTNLEIYSKRNEVKASRLKTFDKALRASMLLCSSASAYVVTLWPTGNSTIKNTHELKGTFLAETVLGLSTAFLSGLIAFLGLTTTITEYEKTASRYDCYRERCTSGYSDCNRVIVKYCEKHKVFDDELDDLRREVRAEAPLDNAATIRDTEMRKRNLDSEWRNTALELNAIYSTWAQTVYDKQKDLPSRLPPRMCDSCSDKLEHMECPKCRQPMEDGTYSITHDFSNIRIDDGEESE